MGSTQSRMSTPDFKAKLREVPHFRLVGCHKFHVARIKQGLESDEAFDEFGGGGFKTVGSGADW